MKSKRPSIRFQRESAIKADRSQWFRERVASELVQLQPQQPEATAAAVAFYDLKTDARQSIESQSVPLLP